MRKKWIAAGIYLGAVIAVSFLLRYLDATVINSIALEQLQNEAGSDLPLRLYHFVRNHWWIPFAFVGIGIGISFFVPSRKEK